MDVTVINENNIEVSIDPPETIVIEVDQGKAGRGIVSVTYEPDGAVYYLEITYTDGTTQLVGPIPVDEPATLVNYYIKASAAITKGDLVMFTGAVGASGVLQGAPASAGLAEGLVVMGIASETMALNGFGYVTSFGLVSGINTTGSAVGETWATGDILYYNPAYVGKLTKVRPTSPAEVVVVAAVTNASAGNGSLFVRVSFYPKLTELSDVYAVSPANNDLIQWSSANNRWQKTTNLVTGGTISETVGGTVYPVASQYDIGTDPNQIPLNQYLGALAYQDSAPIPVPLIINANTSTDAVRITQTGSGNALVVEDSANPDSTPVLINNSGQFIQGYTTALSGAYADTATRLNIGSGAIPREFLQTYSADIYSGVYEFSKSRAGAAGTQTIVQNGDQLGQIRFAGSDGTSFIESARIRADVDGTPGTNDMPGRLTFSTTADGASSPTERMRIDSAGQVGIGVTPSAGQKLVIRGSATGSTAVNFVFSAPTIQTDVTGTYNGFSSYPATVAATFTLTALRHFTAAQSTIGAGSTVSNQYGFYVDSSLTGATNNYGFYSNIASGTGRWNFYAAGSADNYFAGNLYIGTTNPQIPSDLTVEGPTGAFVGTGNNTAANGALLQLGRRRTGLATVQNNDTLGIQNFLGWDAASYINAAQIKAEVDGPPGTNDMPGRLVFSTTADGASSPTERLRIASDGNVTFKNAITETVATLGTSGTIALNPASGTIQTCAAAGTITFTDSLSSGQSISLRLTSGSSFTINWPTITWVTSAGNVAPTLTANDTLVFWKISTTLYGAYVGSGA